MRAWLLACAALALAHGAAPPAAPPDPARLEHIKAQILAKLGLSSRPTPLGAPPRDVVRQILARAADPQTEHHHDTEHNMREIIAIAHRGLPTTSQVHDDILYLYDNSGRRIGRYSNNYHVELTKCMFICSHRLPKESKE